MQKTLVAFSVLYVVTLLVFAWLYFFTPPREVVRETTPATAERPAQPAEKTDQDTIRPLIPQQPAETAAGNPTFDWNSLPAISSELDILKSIGPVQLNVSVNEAASPILSEADARNSIMETLNKHNISVSPDSRSSLNISIRGLWDDSLQVLTYRVSLAVSQTTVMLRPEGPIRTPADIWQRGSYGFAGKLSARDTLAQESVRLAGLFAETYLSANPPPPTTP